MNPSFRIILLWSVHILRDVTVAIFVLLADIPTTLVVEIE
jgi:hypothetical protein